VTQGEFENRVNKKRKIEKKKERTRGKTIAQAGVKKKFWYRGQKDQGEASALVQGGKSFLGKKGEGVAKGRG